MDGGATDGAKLVLGVTGFDRRLGTATDSFRKRLVGIVDFERNIVYAVAVLLDVFRGRMCCAHRRGEQDRGFALVKDVRSLVALPGLEPGVSALRKTKTFAVVVSRLAGVAYPEFDVVNAFQFEIVIHKPLLSSVILRVDCLRHAV